MNEQEIKTFTNLYIKFQERCAHVAKILGNYDSDFKETLFSDWDLDYEEDCYDVSEVDCYMDVDIYALGCHVDCVSLSFPIGLLSATDDQIHLYAQKKYKK